MPANNITKEEAKRITLEVWQYLADDPSIDSKLDHRVPHVNELKEMRNNCPLCQLFLVQGLDRLWRCNGCPLAGDGGSFGFGCVEDSPYGRWENAYLQVKEEYEFQDDAGLPQRAEEIRESAALEIVNKVKAWEVN